MDRLVQIFGYFNTTNDKPQPTTPTKMTVPLLNNKLPVVNREQLLEKRNKVIG